MPLSPKLRPVISTCGSWIAHAGKMTLEYMLSSRPTVLQGGMITSLDSSTIARQLVPGYLVCMAPVKVLQRTLQTQAPAACHIM